MNYTDDDYDRDYNVGVIMWGAILTIGFILVVIGAR